MSVIQIVKAFDERLGLVGSGGRGQGPVEPCLASGFVAVGAGGDRVLPEVHDPAMGRFDRDLKPRDPAVERCDAVLPVAAFVLHLGNGTRGVCGQFGPVRRKCLAGAGGQIGDPSVQRLGQTHFRPLALDQAGQRQLGCGEIAFGLPDTLLDQFDGVGFLQPVFCPAHPRRRSVLSVSRTSLAP